MRDAFFYPLIILAAAGVIGLGLVWPQGTGAPSPPPFGRAIAPLPAPIVSPKAVNAAREQLRGLQGGKTPPANAAAEPAPAKPGS